MTQFMLIKSWRSVAPPPGVNLAPIGKDEEFLQSVARHYFGQTENCCLVTDESGRTESLIDDVWDAQQLHRDIANKPFVKMVRTLLREGVEFICWSAADYRKLPSVRSWEEFERELLSQTAAQPADFYVQFSSQKPPDPG